MNLAYMKHEMYTRNVHLYSSDVLDRRLFCSIDEVKSNKKSARFPSP